MLSPTVLQDGTRNLSLQLAGVLQVSERGKVDYTLHDPVPPKLKLASAVWLIQEKGGVALWWDESNLILVMESRNSVRFDNGISRPKDWNGHIFIEAFNIDSPKRVMIHLEFDK